MREDASEHTLVRLSLILKCPITVASSAAVMYSCT